MEKLTQGTRIKFTQRTRTKESTHVAVVHGIDGNMVSFGPLYDYSKGMPSGYGRYDFGNIGTTKYGIVSFTVIK